MDTNVIIAAMRSRRGASAVILSLIGTGRFDLIMSTAMALEYEHVLKRDADTIGITPPDVDDLVAFLCTNAVRHEPPAPFVPLTPDPGDEFVARLAITGGCDHLVTHNVRHFRDLLLTDVAVVTPAQFLPIIRESK